MRVLMMLGLGATALLAACAQPMSPMQARAKLDQLCPYNTPEQRAAYSACLAPHEDLSFAAIGTENLSVDQMEDAWAVGDYNQAVDRYVTNAAPAPYIYYPRY